MPIINSSSVDILNEKVDAWREVEQESVDRYCEILDILGQLSEQVDGHPEASVIKLNEIKGKIDDLSIGVPERMQAEKPPLWCSNIFVLVGVIFFSSVASTLLTLFLSGHFFF